MIWKGLGFITNTESPIVVVLRYVTNRPNPLIKKKKTPSLYFSGSMEPAFYRGDLLFLTNPSYESYRTGDITVYKIPGAPIPIVHRVLETHDIKPTNSESASGQSLIPRQFLLTKGDNNNIDDIDLYQGLNWLERKHIVGKVRGYVHFFWSGSAYTY
jgi:signal peptidase